MISSLALVALVSGCGKSNESRIAEIKYSLSAGDKILYENADEMILSLRNDSLIVRRNVAFDKSDTIFRTTPSDRIGVYASPGYIALVQKDAVDSIGVYSYDISTKEITSAQACGIGYLPYFDSDCISVISVQKEDDAVYEASFTIGLDGQANGDISLEREICKVAKKRNPWNIFDSEPSDGVYWWQCTWCKESVKSSGEPPRNGCPRSYYHVWNKGNRAE